MNINRESLTIGWSTIKIALILLPMFSLPFILYFGLNGDDPRTAFSKSLIASATTIAVIITIVFCIKHFINKLNQSKAE